MRLFGDRSLFAFVKVISAALLDGLRKPGQVFQTPGIWAGLRAPCTDVCRVCFAVFFAPVFLSQRLSVWFLLLLTPRILPFSFFLHPRISLSLFFLAKLLVCLPDCLPDSPVN